MPLNTIEIFIVQPFILVVNGFSKKACGERIQQVSDLIRREAIGDALKELKNQDEHVLLNHTGSENSLSGWEDASLFLKPP